MMVCQSGRFGAPPASTSYANSGGTGFRARAGIAVTAGGPALGGAGSPADLLDGSPSSGSFYWGTETTVGTTVTFDFKDARVIDEFKWYQDISANQGTWAFEGSNDNSSYSTLTSITLNDGTFSFSNSTAYRYYRLRHTAGTRVSSAYLEQIEFKIDVLTVPSYLNAGGMGSRNSSITISNTGLSVTGAVTALLEGTLGNSAYFNGGTGNGSQLLHFDFGSARQITGFTWYQDLAASHGSWQFEGSTDNSSWTNVHSLTLSATEFLFANTNSYRYYRLRHMSGSTSSSPYIREIEFKILL